MALARDLMNSFRRALRKFNNEVSPHLLRYVSRRHITDEGKRRLETRKAAPMTAEPMTAAFQLFVGKLDEERKRAETTPTQSLHFRIDTAEMAMLLWETQFESAEPPCKLIAFAVKVMVNGASEAAEAHEDDKDLTEALCKIASWLFWNTQTDQDILMQPWRTAVSSCWKGHQNSPLADTLLAVREVLAARGNADGGAAVIEAAKEAVAETWINPAGNTGVALTKAIKLAREGTRPSALLDALRTMKEAKKKLVPPSPPRPTIKKRKSPFGGTKSCLGLPPHRQSSTPSFARFSPLPTLPFTEPTRNKPNLPRQRF
jgi:hypothetical protein